MTGQPGLVSVMMPAYNAASYIAEAIDSVLAQVYEDWELLVVDDGSTDGTADIVARFGDRRIRLIRKANGGEASARNLALDHARGEFLAYLDADDVYLPEHLALTVGYLHAHPDRDAVYTDGFHIDTEGRRLVSLQQRRRGPFEGAIFEEVVRASDVFGPPLCVVLRRGLVVAHELRYDCRIVIGPDWDFFVRVAQLATFGWIPDRTGLYRIHATNITAQVDRARRAAYLAICRENAIRLDGFDRCSMTVRVAVFYDLLVVLLAAQPERQTEVTRWPQFQLLPAVEQCRLLRLMAVEALGRGDASALVGDWIRRAAVLNRSDVRATLLSGLYACGPAVCRSLVSAASALRRREPPTGAFDDLLPHGAAADAAGGSR
jgi:Glycosyl transferase family 2